MPPPASATTQHHPPPPPVFIHRKPIYPPLPADPFYLSDSGDDDHKQDDDILCPNSSDPEDDNDNEYYTNNVTRSTQKRERKQRILRLAERYIRGHDLYIHSAKLRGPVLNNPWAKTKKKKTKTTTTTATTTTETNTNIIASSAATMSNTTPSPVLRRNSNSTAPKEAKLKSYFSARKNVPITKIIGGSEKTALMLDVRTRRRARSEVPTMTTYRGERRREEEVVRMRMLGDEPDETIEKFSMSQPVVKCTDGGVDWSMEEVDGEEGEGGREGTPIGVDIAVRWFRRKEQMKAVKESEKAVNEDAKDQPHLGNDLNQALAKAKENAEVIEKTTKRKRAASVSDDNFADSAATSGATGDSSIDWTKKRPKVDFTNLVTPPPSTAGRDASRKRQCTEPLPSDRKPGNGHARTSLGRSASHMTELEQKKVNAIRSDGQGMEVSKDDKLSAPIEKENIDAPPKRIKAQKEPALPTIPDGSFDGTEPNLNQPVQVPHTPHAAPSLPPPPMANTEATASETPQQERPAPPAPAQPAPTAETESPWQGTQLNLLAAQNDFFKAMAESPLRFDSPERPDVSDPPPPPRGILPLPSAALTPINQHAFSASFLARSSSPPVPVDTQSADGFWSKVLRTPAPIAPTQLNPPPTTIRAHPIQETPPAPQNNTTPLQPSIPPQLLPLTFGFSTNPETSFNHPTTIDSPPKLTPFRAFRTPPPEPRPHYNQESTSTEPHRGVLRFDHYHSSCSPPLAASTATKARKSVGFAATAVDEGCTLESTLEDTLPDDESFVSLGKAGMGMQGGGGGSNSNSISRHHNWRWSNLTTPGSGDSRRADSWSNISFHFSPDDSNNHNSNNNNNNHNSGDRDGDHGDSEHDNTLPFPWTQEDPDEESAQDLTREVAGFMDAGKWDIDEELRKMATSCSTGSVGGRVYGGSAGAEREGWRSRSAGKGAVKGRKRVVW
ncbi:hypothetical protein EX30DRAFT_395973 [Ascodesmis nigricans]|uniref:Uncharacterized protein n=1 Tax=Ascodesmis nigricans TaxID=341454 RepID=A0A4S2MW46_9PEZI|nr:hypothetical protein EX30DRAFT_395973 [Ascodesmis nigricans]